ncbi:MAG: rhomboid family intramembrane serine protease [Flavobacteriaceae bacterium]|nr:rhomboid family intramembrane serine protease [Flavobacteriaceae bacterium]|tara:strand:+ start:1316 stop:2074 length:759 start_codon:yes stop_codon:yes gene_type:complete
MYRISPTVKQLLIINVIFFLGTFLSFNSEFIYSLFGLFFPENINFKFWQILTHMFMHGNLPHILVNMFALWMFGSSVESILGSKNFLFFYLTCGLGAAVSQLVFLYYNYYVDLEFFVNNGYESAEIINILNNKSKPEINSLVNNIGIEKVASIFSNFNSTMVGASGAIMGILVAFGMFFPESKLMLLFLPIPIKAKYFIPAIIIMDLFSAITGQAIFSPSNTAYIAHLGGALTGFIIMYFWKKDRFNKNRWY